MIITRTEITNPDGSITKMVNTDDENGQGCSMTEEAYLATLEALDAKA